jgi:2'-5' RNA ligase
MQEQTYAVVVYLHGPLAHFVNQLRLELDPSHANKLAHISVLPPRCLMISFEQNALEEARAQCADWEPFELEISATHTFLPHNGVVYLSVGRGADSMRCLHETLNQGELAQHEPWNYVPHVTIAQDLDERQTQEIARTVDRRLQEYRGTRTVLVESLTFVKLGEDGAWMDVAEVQLGRAQVFAE